MRALSAGTPPGSWLIDGVFAAGVGHREGEMGDMASGQGSTADALELLGEEGRGKLR